MTVLVLSESSLICSRCDGEGGGAEITNVPWRTAKSLGLGYWVCPDCSGKGIVQKTPGSHTTEADMQRTDLTDMTHEELASHARQFARQNGDDALLDLAHRLQSAVDAEEPSTDLAREIISRLD